MKKEKEVMLSIPVHGTGQNPYNIASMPLLSNLENMYSMRGYDVYKPVGPVFDWTSVSKDILNSPSDRRQAALQLVKYMDNEIKILKRIKQLPSHLNISLLGYSHGGNVAIQTLPFLAGLAKAYGIKITVQLITCSTPAYTSNIKFPGSLPLVNGLNAEDPAGYLSKINQVNSNVKVFHHAISVTTDKIISAALGSNSYDNSYSKNLVFTPDYNVEKNDKEPNVISPYAKKKENESFTIVDTGKKRTHALPLLNSRMIRQILGFVGKDIPFLPSRKMNIIISNESLFFPVVKGLRPSHLRPNN